MRFFDIHTHSAPTSSPELCIRTVIAGRETPPPNGMFSVGVHPWYPCSVTEVVKYASEPRCVAIGECGLDTLSRMPLPEQEALFVEQIALSEQVKKPLIIHCVRTFEQVLRLRQIHSPRQRWVIHGFRKGPQLVRKLLEGGMDIAFGATLLQANPALQDALRVVPSDRLFLETDDQIQIDIESVYKAAAQIRNCTLAALAIDLEQNVKHTFGR